MLNEPEQGTSANEIRYSTKPDSPYALRDSLLEIVRGEYRELRLLRASGSSCDGERKRREQ